MRALLCTCGQYLKADDKEALVREVRAHLKQEDRLRERPLGRFLEEVQVVYAEGDGGTEEGLGTLFFDYPESIRAVVLGTRAG